LFFLFYKISWLCLCNKLFFFFFFFCVPVVVFVFCLCRKKNYEEKKIDKKNSNDDEKLKSEFHSGSFVFFFLNSLSLISNRIHLGKANQYIYIYEYSLCVFFVCKYINIISILTLESHCVFFPVVALFFLGMIELFNVCNFVCV